MTRLQIDRDHRVLVHTVSKPDAQVLATTLAEAEIESLVCTTAEDLANEIELGSAAVIITDESLTTEARGIISEALSRQPEWSDLPLIFLVPQSSVGSSAWQLLREMDGLTHSLILDRPVRMSALVDTVRGAMRTRQRQYRTREELNERRAAERALRMRERQHATVAMLGQKSLEGYELQGLLDSAVTAISEVLDVELCKVLELLPGGHGLLLRAGVGWPSGLVGNAVVGSGPGSQAGYTLEQGAPVIVDELASDDRFRGPPLLLENGVMSGISVQIGSAESPWGVIGVHTRCRRRFSSDDAHFLRSVANVLSTAISRERDEKMIRAGQERLQLAKEASGLGIFDFDIENDAIHWDERIREIWGVGDDESISYATFEQGLHEEDREGARQRVAEAVDPSGDGRYSAEYRVVNRKTGRTRWISATGCVTFEHGRAKRLIGTVLDITQRKHDEEARALLAAVVAGSSDAIVSKDLDGIILSWNHGAERLFGYTAEEAIGKTIMMIIPPDRRDEECELLARLRVGRAVEQVETVRVTNAGRRIDVSLSISPIRDEQGRVIGDSTVARDIGDRLRAERELRESRERLQLISDHVPVLISYIDSDRRYQWVNRAYLTELKRSEAEIVGRSVRDVMGEENYSAIEPHLDSGLRGERLSYEFEFRLPGSDDVRYKEVTYVPHRGDNGEVLGVFVLVVDITDHKRHEEQMQIVMAELNHRVKNTLALVQSIAMNSMRTGNVRTIDQFVKAFHGRLQALSTSHRMLTETSWQGGLLSTLVGAIFRPYVGDETSRVRVAGPEVVLLPKTTQSLSMILHELASNAAKYGALSRPKARVEICWHVILREGDRWLELEWREEGGPVVEEPSHEGFGRTLIRRMTDYELGGEMSQDFRPQGLVCRFCFPFRTNVRTDIMPDLGIAAT